MKGFFKKNDATSNQAAMPKYSIRVLNENWVETAQILRRDYNKEWLEITSANGIVDGKETEVTRITFESDQNEYIEIRVNLALKKIDEIEEKTEEPEEKK